MPIRRPHKLEDPPPGLRCPACWQSQAPPEGKPIPIGAVTVCDRCFVFIIRTIPSQYHRLVPTDLMRLRRDLARELCERREQLMLAAAERWRLPPQA